jgi:hypothetical protein
MELSNKVPTEVKNISYDIGEYYLLKNDYDYRKTEEEIQSLKIGGIEITDNGIHIYTSRPGQLIGPKGKNIEALELFLKKKVLIHECVDYAFLCTPFDLDEWERNEGLGNVVL